VDSNGHVITAAAAAALASNGVVSRTAKLKIAVADGSGSDIPVQPGSTGLNDQVSVNGNPVKGVITTTLPPVGTFGGRIFLLTFDVNIEYLKFPHRTPGSVSLEVQNGAFNLVSISPDLGVFERQGPPRSEFCGTEHRNPQIGPVWIEFQAMSPVILVTGCCDETLNYWRNSDVGATLVDEFRRRNIPFADHDPNSTHSLLGHIGEGGRVLAGQVIGIAKEFGVHWVHLVAHSKGGPNARYLLGEHSLPTTGPNAVGVHSLVTLDTPHYGSVGADYVYEVYYNHHEIGFGFSSRNDIALNLAIWNRVSNERKFRTQWDLTQAAVAGVFDVQYPDPPPNLSVNNELRPLSIRALSSDANRDCSTSGSDSTNAAGQVTHYARRTINSSEAVAWVLGQYTLEPLYNVLGTSVGVTLQPTRRTDSNGRPVKTVQLKSSTYPFFLNDGAVTGYSQSYLTHPKFIPLTPVSAICDSRQTYIAQGLTFGDNHNSVGNSTIAGLIADFINQLPSFPLE
jgi:hypothetical protein